ncbi:hypothetical protein PM082_010480 [Marasmius tenuissimus]|nr:hypothetical protein PM082_010480 [Marasmius tenuissimus]
MLRAKLEETIKLREEELRNDTNARFVDPHNVWCVICDRNIKLSDKSRFDLSHWREHKRKKHGIRGHSTRGLVENVKERKQRQRQRKSFVVGDATATTTSSSSRTVDRKSLTIRLYPSPPSSQSSSSSGDTPGRKPTGRRRFNPIPPATSSSSSSSSSLRRSKRNQSSKHTTPLYTTTRLQDSPLTSSSFEDDPTVPLPSLPDFRISSEMEAYVHFERLDLDNNPVMYVDLPSYHSSSPDRPWTSWTFSRLTVPGWCVVDEVDDFELKRLAPTLEKCGDLLGVGDASEREENSEAGPGDYLSSL